MVGSWKRIPGSEPPLFESLVWGKHPDGRRRPFRERRQFRTEREFQKWHSQRLLDAQNGKLESKKDVRAREKREREKAARESIGAGIDAFLKRLTPELQNSTRIRYLGIAEQLKALVGERSIASFTRADAHALFETYGARGGRGGIALSGASVKQARSVLQQTLDAAVEYGVIAANPMVGMTPGA